jgi:hypothetical protein
VNAKERMGEVGGIKNRHYICDDGFEIVYYYKRLEFVKVFVLALLGIPSQE